jgi:hypothetical protein
LTCECSRKRPCDAGCTCSRLANPPTGVVSDKVGQFGERYTINGRPASRRQALDAVAAGHIPDDARKLRLTIIGDETARNAVLSDLRHHAALQALKDELVVQDYAPDAALIRGLGFKTDGKPSIYLQEPSGRVLLRQDRYDDAETLASAIRRADPRYDPTKDPDGRKTPRLWPPSTRIPPLAWIAAAAGILLLLWRSKP